VVGERKIRNDCVEIYTPLQRQLQKYLHKVFFIKRLANVFITCLNQEFFWRGGAPTVFFCFVAICFVHVVFFVIFCFVYQKTIFVEFSHLVIFKLLVCIDLCFVILIQHNIIMNIGTPSTIAVKESISYQ